MNKFCISICIGCIPAIGNADQNFPFDVPSYVEQATNAGISHQYTGGFSHFVGGGGAAFDCNADRMPDVFLAGGASRAKLYINQSKTGKPLEFKEHAFLISGKEITKVVGAYPINLDNDAHTDLVVLRQGKNILLKGQGDCTFVDANKLYDFDGGRAWTTGFSAIWDTGANYPSLAFGNYIDQKAAGAPWGTCEDNIVAHSAQDAPLFTQQSVLSPGFCSLSIMFTDWNNSDQFDLRITNDRQYHRGGYEQMWSLSGSAPKEYGAADGWRKLVIWGMGIAQADLNGDGRPEYALSSMGDTMLQTLDEDADEDLPIYADISFDKGSTAHRPYVGDNSKPSTGWHTHFADFNNDARTDLYIAKGNVEQMPDFAQVDPDNLLLGNLDSSFSEQGDNAGIALPRRGRGALITDFNADGMLDILVINREEPVSLFRNVGTKTNWGHVPMGNFVAIELQNGPVNPDAIGAKLSIKTGNLNQTRTVSIGGGHASGQTGFHHFGLGVAERAEIRVKWPDGDWSQPYKVFANNFVVINKDDPNAKYWYPQ